MRDYTYDQASKAIDAGFKLAQERILKQALDAKTPEKALHHLAIASMVEEAKGPVAANLLMEYSDE